MTFFHRFLFTLDVLANALIGGSVHQTLSARAHRTANKQHPYWGWTERFIDKLFFWQPNHCYETWLYELSRPVPTLRAKDYVYTIAGLVLSGLLIYWFLQWLR